MSAELQAIELTTISGAPATLGDYAGKVLLVVQGHSHENEQAVIGGIPYLILRAVVLGPGRENSAAALLTLGPDGVCVLGFGQQTGWPS